MIFTPKQIDEIEAGMKVYINLNTHEIKSIFDWEDSFGDTDEWEEEQAAIEKEWTSFAVITKMESRESYRVMESFVKEIQDKYAAEFGQSPGNEAPLRSLQGGS